MSVSVYAVDAAKAKKCQMMSEMAASIVDDRDRGMKRASRVAKNNMAASDMPALNEYLANLTQAIYGELKGRPKLEIANAAFYACMQVDN